MSCDELSDSLKILPRQLDKFTKSLIAISTVEAFDPRGHSAEELNKLRDDIRNDVLEYASNTMPSCIKFVNMLRRFFDKWSSQPFENWLSMSQDIINELDNLQKRCQKEYENHVKLTGYLKSSKMSANQLAKEMEQMSMDSAAEKKNLEKSAASYSRWNTATKVLIIGLIVNFGYSEEQAKLEQNAARAETQLQLSKAATDILGTDLIPALNKIIESLLQSSQSLSKLRSNLNILKDQAEDALREKLKEQYNAMKHSIGDINRTCSELHAISPHVESDLLALKGRP